MLAVVAEPVPIASPEPAPPASGLLNDRERKRIDGALAGLSRFSPVADPVRPTPRTEVDPLSSVSAADWSGMDGMGEEIAPLPPPMPRREATPAPVAQREAIATPAAATLELEVAPAPTTDPARGWVTAERLFSDFGD